MEEDSYTERKPEISFLDDEDGNVATAKLLFAGNSEVDAGIGGTRYAAGESGTLVSKNFCADQRVDAFSKVISVRKPITVVIPTYNRASILAKALEGYREQSSPDLIRELIIIDDGSTDNTSSIVKQFSNQPSFPIRYFHQSNKGPAAARNLGIREAQSSVILFTDSDIVPERNLVAEHVHFHEDQPALNAAVLGYVTWSPEIRTTPFMRWYGEERMFEFKRLRDNAEVSYRYFYTCNISLKTEFLRASGGFDEDFKSAAYEDSELGFRLSKMGLQLLYNRAAIGYHYQFFSFEDACKKAVSNVASAEVFSRKEAGQQMQKDAELRHTRVGFGLAKGFAKRIVKVLHPARHLLDSAFPLPGRVYHLFYWEATREAGKPKPFG